MFFVFLRKFFCKLFCEDFLVLKDLFSSLFERQSYREGGWWRHLAFTGSLRGWPRKPGLSQLHCFLECVKRVLDWNGAAKTPTKEPCNVGGGLSGRATLPVPENQFSDI